MKFDIDKTVIRMVRAETCCLDEINALYKECTLYLLNSGIFQWDDIYPNLDIYKKAVAEKSLYKFVLNENLIGAVILDAKEAIEWALVNWRYSNSKALVIHALVIKPSVQGVGYGRKILKICEDYAIKEGYKSIRLDAFPENKSAVKLYENSGYFRAGKVTLGFKPINHQLYVCYEKLL